MFRIRQHHWYILASAFLIAGLGALWAPPWRRASERRQKDDIVRRRVDLPQTDGSAEVSELPFQRPPQARLPAQNLSIPVQHNLLPESGSLPDANFGGELPALPFAPSSPASPVISHGKLGVPESVWLSGSIENLDAARQ